MFRNRTEAAQQLAQRLNGYTDENPLVLAIPRGAVPMGRIIADALYGALDAVRRAAPKRLIVAVAVAPRRTLSKLRDAADDVICLEVSETFVAVGQAFRKFGPVTDEDLVRILRSEHEAWWIG